jgi:hypothetical protein
MSLGRDTAQLMLAVACASFCADCRTALRGHSRHQPMEMYGRLREQRKFSTPPALPRLKEGLRIAVLPFDDRTVSPTGLLLSDNEVGTVAAILYLPHLAPRLEGFLVEALRASGARAYQACSQSDLPGASERELAVDRLLTVRLDHAELHRWQKGEPWPGLHDANIDLVRVVYSYDWLTIDGKPTASGDAAHELYLPATQVDDLEVVAQAMAAQILDGYR